NPTNRQAPSPSAAGSGGQLTVYRDADRWCAYATTHGGNPSGTVSVSIQVCTATSPAAPCFADPRTGPESMTYLKRRAAGPGPAIVEAPRCVFASAQVIQPPGPSLEASTGEDAYGRPLAFCGQAAR